MMLCFEPHYVELLKYEVINLIEIKIYAPADLNHRMEMRDRHSLYCSLSTPLITASCTELVRPEKVGLIPEKRQEE